MKRKKKVSITQEASQAEEKGAWETIRPLLLKLSPLFVIGGSIYVTSTIFRQPIWICLLVGIALGAVALAMLGRLTPDFGKTGFCRLPANQKLEHCRFYSPTSWKGGCLWREGGKCISGRH